MSGTWLSHMLCDSLIRDSLICGAVTHSYVVPWLTHMLCRGSRVRWCPTATARCESWDSHSNIQTFKHAFHPIIRGQFMGGTWLTHILCRDSLKCCAVTHGCVDVLLLGGSHGTQIQTFKHAFYAIIRGHIGTWLIYMWSCVGHDSLICARAWVRRECAALMMYITYESCTTCISHELCTLAFLYCLWVRRECAALMMYITYESCTTCISHELCTLAFLYCLWVMCAYEWVSHAYKSLTMYITYEICTSYMSHELCTLYFFDYIWVMCAYEWVSHEYKSQMMYISCESCSTYMSHELCTLSFFDYIWVMCTYEWVSHEYKSLTMYITYESCTKYMSHELCAWVTNYVYEPRTFYTTH